MQSSGHYMIWKTPETTENNVTVIFMGKKAFLSMFRSAEKVLMALMARHCTSLRVIDSACLVIKVTQVI